MARADPVFNTAGIEDTDIWQGLLPHSTRAAVDAAMKVLVGMLPLQPTYRHLLAGVRVSMLRPRFVWSSISAASPITRP